MLSTSIYLHLLPVFCRPEYLWTPINETFYDDFVTFNAHLLSKKLLQFYRYFAESIFIYEIHKIFYSNKNKRNKNHTLYDYERKERVFKMIKSIIKLLVKLTANFLIRYLVKKYISRIFWPHMNILLTYQNKHVHIIIYIFS